MNGWLDRRIERSRRTLFLGIGDLFAIAAFVAAGEVRHGGTLVAGATTLGEFAIGWAIAAVLVGAYGPDAVATWRRGVALAVLGWVPGAAIGQVIRAILQPGFYVFPSFLAVSIGAGVVLLGTWRGLAARWFRTPG